MLANVTKMRFDSWGRMLNFCISSMITVTIIGLLRDGDVNFKLVCTLLCGITGVFEGQFIISIMGEITSILGIEVFTTKQVQRARNEKNALKAKAKKGKSTAVLFEKKTSSFSEEATLSPPRKNKSGKP